MRFHIITRFAAAMCLLVGGICLAEDVPAPTPAPPPAVASEAAPPSWAALLDNAKEMAADQYNAADLVSQIDVKRQTVTGLREQRAALQKEMESATLEGGKAMREIDRIDDLQLRDESLLRFKSSKDVRMQTLAATSDAVDQNLGREEKELAALERALQGRQAAARLSGVQGVAQGDYGTYLAGEAERARDSEQATYGQLIQRQSAALAAAIMPRLEPRLPNLMNEVMNATP